MIALFQRMKVNAYLLVLLIENLQMDIVNVPLATMKYLAIKNVHLVIILG